MACLKCGSSWVTRWGYDKLSCPECCKQQRAKARRLGKIPSSMTKVCEGCGSAFEAVGGNAIRHSRHCGACKLVARKEWLERYKADIKAGLRVPAAKQQSPRPKEPLKCQWCGGGLDGKNQQKYCSNKCFVDARNSGQQSWDRTAQLASNARRCGLQLTPSRRGLSKVLNGFNGFMVKLRAFRRRISRLRCLTCDAFVASETSRFCSDECCAAYEFKSQCIRCGKETKFKGYRGPKKRRMCGKCRVATKREWKRKNKRGYGGNHPSRARHHGVKCVRFPRKMIFERDGYVCQLCGRKTLLKVTYRKSDGKIHPRSPTVDCIIAMENGGNYEPQNCQTACFICNSRKGAANRGQLRLNIT